MSMTSLESLINDNRRRIAVYRATLPAEAVGDGGAALRLRVLQQMELSLKCLERQRDELASRLTQTGFSGPSAA